MSSVTTLKCLIWGFVGMILLFGSHYISGLAWEPLMAGYVIGILVEFAIWRF